MRSSERKIPEDLGLHSGQWHPDSKNLLFNIANWYDQDCKSIGGGDIWAGQPEMVSKRLENGELLAIVSSHIIRFPLTAREQRQGRTEDQPGVDFIARNFGMLIVPTCIYLPELDGVSDYAERTKTKYPTLSAEGAIRIIKSISLLHKQVMQDYS